MNDYKVYENQTLQDVSAHVYGRVDMAIDLALLNNISISANLQAGQIIKMIDAPINILVTKALESRKIIPATNISVIKKEKIIYGFPYGFPIAL